MQKKCLALLLAVAMFASLLVSPAMAVDYPDAQTSWAKSSIERWSDAGIVGGDDQGKINPDQALRRAELAIILVRLLGLTERAPMGTFTDVPAGAWYEDAILKCAAAGIMQGWNGHVDPLDNITREEAITMVGRALGVKPQAGQGLDQFLDAGKVQGYAQQYMAPLTALGILKGVGDGTRVAPQDYIDRASALALLDKAIGAYVTRPGNVTVDNANTFVVVNVKGAQRSDVVTITGVAAGVAVTIGNTADVTVSGLTAGTVKVDAPVDVAVAESSKLGDVTLNVATALKVEKGATVDGVNVSVANTTVTNAGVIGTLSANAAATIDNQGTVSNLTANANGVVIKGTDAVKTVTANGTSVDSSGAKAPPANSTVVAGGGGTSGDRRPGSGNSGKPTIKDFTVVPGNLGVINESSTLPDNGLATGYKAEGKTSDEGKTVSVSLTADSLKAHKRNVDPEDAEAAWWIGFGMPIETGKTYTYLVDKKPVDTVSDRVQEVDGKSYNTVYFSLGVEDANKEVTCKVDQIGDVNTVTYQVTIKVAKLMDEAGNLVAPITPDVDKTALNNAITAAQAAADAITVDTAAENVDKGVMWVTAEDKATYQAVIDTAQAVLVNDSATQADVDAAVTALATATDAFEAAQKEGTKEGEEPPVVVVNKDALNSAIATANTAKIGVLTAENGENVLNTKKWVTADEMKALEDAIDAAQAVANKTDATQDEVDDAVDALTAAIDTFTEAKKSGEKAPDPDAADTSALETAIANATNAKTGVNISVDGTNVEPTEEWVDQATMDALNQAIADAQAVLDNESATQETVVQATADLNAAINTFEAAKTNGTKANKTALNTAIANANSAKADVETSTNGTDVEPSKKWVTSEQMAALGTAIATAQGVLNDDSATQEDVDQAVTALTTAIDTFNEAKQNGTKEEQPPVVVDKKALTDAIAAANSAKTDVEISTDGTDVEPSKKWVDQAALDALNDAITTAQNVVDDENATQEQVDQAVTALTTAIDTFNDAKQDGTQGTDPEDGDTSGTTEE